MIYLISQNKSDLDAANQTITQNMGLGDAGEVTIAWDQPRQINAPSGEGMSAIPAHPVYLLDPLKLGWWAIQKPEDRFMFGVNLQQI